MGRESGTNSFSGFIKRRKAFLSFMNAVVAYIHKPRIRDVWTHQRTATWFEMVTVSYTDEQWYQNFRVTKTTFMFILHEIQEEISRQDTTMIHHDVCEFV